MPRIGVALAVPEPWATQLQDYRTGAGDATGARIPTHITLVPPVEVDSDRLPGVEAHLAEAAATVAPFVVHLRGTGTFRPVSPVVFVAVVEGIAGCEQLSAAVCGGQLRVDPAFPYHPHVTVAHHLDDDCLDRAFADLADFECAFEATRFHLYVEDPADGWRATRDFRLDRASGPPGPTMGK